jgi:hypothetical protein
MGDQARQTLITGLNEGLRGEGTLETAPRAAEKTNHRDELHQMLARWP